MTRPCPRLAVLIPAYNAERTILRAIQSLNANSEPHDIVVIDDGSAQPLREIVPAQDNLVILRNERNRGVTEARNQGLAYILEHGYAFVAKLDADDAARPDRLARQIGFFDRHPDVALLGSRGRVVSERGEVLFYLNHPTTQGDRQSALLQLPVSQSVAHDPHRYLAAPRRLQRGLS